jgi:hypothetical protein
MFDSLVAVSRVELVVAITAAAVAEVAVEVAAVDAVDAVEVAAVAAAVEGVLGFAMFAAAAVRVFDVAVRCTFAGVLLAVDAAQVPSRRSRNSRFRRQTQWRGVLAGGRRIAAGDIAG